MTSSKTLLEAARKLGAYAGLATVLMLSVARPADAIVYPGRADLALAVSLVRAGSDARGFHTRLLFARMYGANAASESRDLNERYGATQVGEFMSVMDYAIADLLRMMQKGKTVLPNPDATASASPEALVIALDRAGRVPDGRFDVGYMLEHMMTHPLHHLLMNDIDSVYRPAVNEAFHVVLTSVIEDAVRDDATDLATKRRSR